MEKFDFEKHYIGFGIENDPCKQYYLAIVRTIRAARKTNLYNDEGNTIKMLKKLLFDQTQMMIEWIYQTKSYDPTEFGLPSREQFYAIRKPKRTLRSWERATRWVLKNLDMSKVSDISAEV